MEALRRAPCAYGPEYGEWNIKISISHKPSIYFCKNKLDIRIIERERGGTWIVAIGITLMIRIGWFRTRRRRRSISTSFTSINHLSIITITITCSNSSSRSMMCFGSLCLLGASLSALMVRIWSICTTTVHHRLCLV